MSLVVVALAWAAYFALHSLLAASGIKDSASRQWPCLAPGYRLAYNVVAVVTLMPVLWLVHDSAGDWLWQWQGAWAWLADGLALAALACLFATTRAYDMGEFLGLRQLRAGGEHGAGAFTISTFHRFVRHPWYCIGLVLIWTRDMNGPLLVSALAISAYLVVGSKLEERKLVASHGGAYRRYMARVPGLIPLPWKYLTAAEAAALTAEWERWRTDAAAGVG